MPTEKEIFDKKLDFLDNSELKLKKTVSSAERWLYGRILNELIPSLKTLNGSIINSPENVNTLTNGLNRIFKEFNKTINRNIVKQVVGDFTGISTLNNEFFTLLSDKSEAGFKSITSTVEKLMQKSLGYNANGTIASDSFLSSLTSNSEVNKQIRELALKNIQGGNSIKNFTAELSNAIKTDKNGLGVMNRYYRQTVNDRYSQYERAESKSYADLLELQAFIYSGGKVQETRKFCCQRNGKVFTRDEASHWSSLKWDGKNKGYVPLVDLGGYNCRHSTQWISNRQALKRRPDLKLSKSGKLIRNKDVPRQKLHKCA